MVPVFAPVLTGIKYHDFGDFPWTFRLKRLLYTRAWFSNERQACCLILLPHGCCKIRSCHPQPRLWQGWLAKFGNGQVDDCGECWLCCLTAGRSTTGRFIWNTWRTAYIGTGGDAKRSSHYQWTDIYRHSGVIHGVFPAEFLRSACHPAAKFGPLRQWVHLHPFGL